MASLKKSKHEPPADGDPGEAYGQPPTGEYDPSQGFGPLPGYGPPGGFGSASDAPVPMRPDGPARARTGLVVLVAFLFELVLLAGWGNQWVTRRVFNHVGGTPTLHNDLLRASLTYQWRFRPVGGSDFAHMWLGQLLYVVTVLVLSTLLIIPAVRGVVTFWRAFFGVWTAVLAASLVAAYLRAAIIDPSAFGNQLGSRTNNTLFGQESPNGLIVLAGLALGLLVALLTAIIATATRRTPMVAVAPVLVDGPPPPSAEPPPPYYGEDDNSRTQVIDTGRQPGGYGFEKDPIGRNDGARHAAESEAEADARSDNATRELPAFNSGPSPSPAGPTGESDGEQPDVTTQFPRPVTGGYVPPESPDRPSQIAEEPSAAEAATSTPGETGSAEAGASSAGMPGSGADAADVAPGSITTDASEPATDDSEPATSAFEPATSASEPATSASEPATSASEPATSASEPATDAAEPATIRPRPSGPETTRFADPPSTS